MCYGFLVIMTNTASCGGASFFHHIESGEWGERNLDWVWFMLVLSIGEWAPNVLMECNERRVWSHVWLQQTVYVRVWGNW